MVALDFSIAMAAGGTGGPGGGNSELGDCMDRDGPGVYLLLSN